jgi:hypothetical protein
MQMPLLRSLFGQTDTQVDQSDIVMLLTPHVVRTHELTVENLSSIFIGTQQNVGLGGPPPLIAPQQPEPLPPVGATGNPAAQPANPALAPGTSTVPTLTPPGPSTPAPGTPNAPTAPGGNPTTGVAPAPGVTPPSVSPAPGAVTVPPRDPNAPPAATPAQPAPANATAAQVIVTPPGTEFRVAGGPYTVPISINNASRVSLMTLTVTFNPAVLRVRTVQDGTFMRQGGVTATFTPRIDIPSGRVDIAVARSGDTAGASGSGLLAALLIDAVGPGSSLIQVSGIASTPEGGPVSLQFSPVTVTVR